MKCNLGGIEQHLFPVVLFDGRDTVLIDCGYPGSLNLLEEQLRKHNIQPGELTRLVLTHQDDDHSSRLMKEQGLRFVFLFTQFLLVPELCKKYCI